MHVRQPGLLGDRVQQQGNPQAAPAIARNHPDSVLHRFAWNTAELDLAAVIQAFEAGDGALEALVGEVGHYLGIAISHIVGDLSPPYVLITGSVVGFGPPLIDIINQEVGRRSLASAVSHTRSRLPFLAPTSCSWARPVACPLQHRGAASRRPDRHHAQ